MRTLTRLAAGAVVAGAAIAAPLTATAGVIGPAFYVDGELYRTVITKTDLPAKAPAHSFDNIYDFGGAQMFNVADAAPGVGDYNGGRWEVHALSFPEGYDALVVEADANGSGDIDSIAELHDGMDAGLVTDEGVVKRFVCTVNRFPQNA